MNRNLNVIIISSSLDLLSIYLSVIFANWLLFILKMFHLNFAFTLSYTGNKPPQALMIAVARFQELKSPNQSFFS